MARLTLSCGPQRYFLGKCFIRMNLKFKIFLKNFKFGQNIFGIVTAVAIVFLAALTCMSGANPIIEI